MTGRRAWAIAGMAALAVAGTLAGAAPTQSAFSGETQSPSNSFSAWTADPGCNAYGMSVGSTASLNHFWRLGETAGTQAVDALGTQHGTYVGSPALRVSPHSTSDIDTAARFVAGTSYANIGDVNDFAVKAPFTVEGWIRPGGTPGGIEPVIDKGGSTSDGWALRRNSSGRLSLRRVSDGTVSEAVGTTVLAANTWYHVAGTYDGITLKVYVNGVEDGTASSTGSLLDTTVPLRLAGAQSGGGFTGKLDDVAVYTSALPAKTILSHAQIDCTYQRLVDGTGGLIGYWALDETTGPTAVDRYAARNGTYSGAYTLGRPGALPSSPRTAVQFNSTGQALVPHDKPLRLDGAFTIEFWVKRPAVVSVSYPGLLGRGDPRYTGQGFLVYHHAGNNQISFKRDDIDVSKTLSGSVDDNEFHHVAFSYDGATMRVYQDGALVDTDAYSLAPSTTTTDLTIGHGFSANDGLTLDEVALYNRALTSTEVVTHYNAR